MSSPKQEEAGKPPAKKAKTDESDQNVVQRLKRKHAEAHKEIAEVHKKTAEARKETAELDKESPSFTGKPPRLARNSPSLARNSPRRKCTPFVGCLQILLTCPWNSLVTRGLTLELLSTRKPLCKSLPI
jgi:hypothetical protein